MMLQVPSRILLLFCTFVKLHVSHARLVHTRRLREPMVSMGTAFAPKKEMHHHVLFEAQWPSSGKGSQQAFQPQGTFLLLHSCAHHSSDWFLLPEESQITQEVLNRGFVALAAEAYPSVGGCWHPTLDGPLLWPAIHLFLKKHELESKPLYGVGMSSGGVMLGTLITAYSMKFDGVHFAVSPGVAPAGPATTPANPGLFATHKFPRTSFVFMAKDLYAAPETVSAAADALRNAGTPVLVLEHKAKPVQELLKRAHSMGLTSQMINLCIEKMWDWGYLESRCDGCVAGVARSLNEDLFLEYGNADNTVQRLLVDPEVGGFLRPIQSTGRALMEEVHVVEALHGPTADHIVDVLNFLLSNNNAIKDGL